MTGTTPRTAVIVGAGPAGLMAADVLSAAGVAVTVTDRMPSVGRKFLMAGKSGLNLTKMEDDATFAAAYGAASPALLRAVASFGPQHVAAWAEDLGQPVFTGSTGRLFPVAMKASPLLRAWLARLTARGVTFRTRWTWQGWAGRDLRFDTPDGSAILTPDVTILACGGASWARLGSNGKWADHMTDVAPFRPANCGFAVDWSPHMVPVFGQPMKAVRLIAGAVTSRGEWVITRKGIEGGGVYAVSAAVRDGAALHVDLLPDLTPAALRARLDGSRRKSSLSQILKSTLRLPANKIALFNEMRHSLAPDMAGDWLALIKNLPIAHRGPLPLDEAISTVGGLRWDALDGFRLRARPDVFAAGEMLEWEAPTGGYLITGCLATGRAAARTALGSSE